MRRRNGPTGFRAFIALEQQVTDARLRLQRASETDPGFENKVKQALELTEQLDRALKDVSAPHGRGPAGVTAAATGLTPHQKTARHSSGAAGKPDPA